MSDDEMSGSRSGDESAPRTGPPVGAKPIEYEGVQDRLPWRISAASLGQDIEELGMGMLEELPSGSYVVEKLSNGGIRIGTKAAPSKQQAQKDGKAAKQQAADSAAAAAKDDSEAVEGKKKKLKRKREEEALEGEAAAAATAGDGEAKAADHKGSQRKQGEAAQPKAKRVRTGSTDAPADDAEMSGTAAAAADDEQEAEERGSVGKKSRASTAAGGGSGSGSGRRYEPGALGPALTGGMTVQAALDEWGQFNVHPVLLARIAALGYRHPTPVQLQALPPAMLHYKDIVGAAATGSGKTLAYGLPIIQRLLERRERLGMGSVAAGVRVPSISHDGRTVLPHDDAADDAADASAGVFKAWRYLPALVLAPTRELAMQVRDHLSALSTGTAVKAVAIVGGLAHEKQERQIRSHPDIIVATPGRLWDLVASGRFPYLSALHKLQFLVLDEADRLVEKGHFDSLNNLLASLKAATDGSKAAPAVVDEEAEKIVAALKEKARKAAKAEAAEAAEAGAAAAAAVGKGAKGKVKGKASTLNPALALDDDDTEENEDEAGAKDAKVMDADDDDDDDEAEEDGAAAAASSAAASSGGSGPRKHRGVPESAQVDTPAHYRRQTFLFSATLGVATAQSIKEAAEALVRSQAVAASGGADAGKGKGKGAQAKMSKKAYRRALATASQLTPVEALMARVGVLGKPAVISVHRQGSVTAAASLTAIRGSRDGKEGDNDDDEEEEEQEGDSGEGGKEVGGSDDDEEEAEAEEKEAGSGAVSAVSLPPGLRLARITCSAEDKEVMLYYFLTQYPGRTLVFVNAISVLKRVAALLAALRLPVHTLHANMQQRQRLTHLERFRADPNGVLVATDVAARGLDIPSVPYVLHHSLPGTAETFVHRCGRTARASSQGLAVTFAAPRDQRDYNRIMSVLGISVGLPEFPVDSRFMRKLTARVSVARRIAVEQAALDRDTSEQQWLLSQAAEAGLAVDVDTAAEVGVAVDEAVARAAAASMGGAGAASSSSTTAAAAAKGKQKGKSKKGNGKPSRRADDDDEGDGEGGSVDLGAGMDDETRAEAVHSAKVRRAKIAGLRRELDDLLAEPLLPTGISSRYVTGNSLLNQAAHPLQSMIKIGEPSSSSASGGGGGASGSSGAAVASKSGSLVAPAVSLPLHLLGGASGAASAAGVRGVAHHGGPGLPSAMSALAAKGRHVHMPGAKAKAKAKHRQQQQHKGKQGQQQQGRK